MRVRKALWGIVRRFATRLAGLFRQRFFRGEPSIWTKEEQEDFDRWEAEFGKSCGDPEREVWLDIAEAEFEWNKPVPSC